MSRLINTDRQKLFGYTYGKLRNGFEKTAVQMQVIVT